MRLTWHRHTDDAHDGPFYRFTADDISATVWYDGYTGWHWQTTAEGKTHQGTERRMTECRWAAVADLEKILTACGIDIPEYRPRKVGCWYRLSA